VSIESAEVKLNSSRLSARYNPMSQHENDDDYKFSLP